MLRLFFIFLSVSFSAQGFSQNQAETIEYSKLANYKVDEDRFEFGWLENVFSGIPCLRDYSKNKIQTTLVDPKTNTVIYTSSEPKIYSLKIIADKITLDKTNKLFKISGQITGAWEDVMPREFQIYVGHRHDTISNLTLSPDLHATIFYNGAKVDSTVIVDRVPAFYMTNLQKFNAYRGTENLVNSKYKQMLFDITATIDNNSILVFALSSGYAEIFEIGKLLTQ